MSVLNLNTHEIDRVYIGDTLICGAGWKSGDILKPSAVEEAYEISDKLKEIWSFTGHTAPIRAVAIDSEGNVYSGGDDSSVRKINKDGQEIWSFTGHTDFVRAVATDSEGNVYSGGDDSSIRKINKEGQEVWRFKKETREVYAVAVDSEGNIYSGSLDYSVKKTNKGFKKFLGYKILENKGDE